MAFVTADGQVLLQTAEVAGLLHVSPKTVNRWSQEGKLPFIRTLGGHRRFPEVAIRRIATQMQWVEGDGGSVAHDARR